MRRVLFIAAMLLGLTAVGTIGIHIISGEAWLRSLYLAVITLTTVGSEDVGRENDTSMIFVLVYLIFGLGIFTYSAFQLGQWVVDAQVHSMLVRRRMEKAISKLRNHYIVCGNGRMGRTICEYLQERNRPFVVVEIDDEILIPVCEERGWLYILGDATNDDVRELIEEQLVPLREDVAALHRCSSLLERLDESDGSRELSPAAVVSLLGDVRAVVVGVSASWKGARAKAKNR